MESSTTITSYSENIYFTFCFFKLILSVLHCTVLCCIALHCVALRTSFSYERCVCKAAILSCSKQNHAAAFAFAFHWILWRKSPITRQQTKSREKKLTSSVLTFVLYGCESWPLTLRKWHRLRVFHNEMLSGVFQCMRNWTGGCRQLHKQTPIICTPVVRVIWSSRMKWTARLLILGWGGGVGGGEMRNVWGVAVWNLNGFIVEARNRCDQWRR
jgi:hypothetical protein